MKVYNNPSPTEVSGSIGETEDFTIAGTKESFRILSSGLYNDKELAVVRELSCNAYDAHVAAGKKDIPFEIHLPTAFEPWLTIKDFGTGLSNDQIIGTLQPNGKRIGGLYKTYFESNKSNSNDFVGSFGLGSKSPFCKVDGFTVISRHDCMERIYSVFIQENGKPGIVLQSEEWIDEDEPLFFLATQNGLEVSLPVKKEDISAYKNAAATALEFFEPLPILNEYISINKKEYQIKNEKWGLRKERYYYDNQGLRAVQGMVAYKVGTIDDSKLSDKAKHTSRLAIDLFFPIGDLSVAASRESLSNDERTITNLADALDKIADHFIEETKLALDVCKTKWEALIKIEEFRTIQGMQQLLDAAIKNGQFLGQYTNFYLDSVRLTINEFDYNAALLYKMTTSHKRKHDANKDSQFYERSLEGKQAVREKIKAGTQTLNYYNIEIVPKPNALVVINDIKHGGEKYLHWYLQHGGDDFLPIPKDNHKRVAYFITRINKNFPLELLEKEALKIVNKLGNPTVTYLSQFRDKYKDTMTEYYKIPTPGKTPSSSPNDREVVWFDKTQDISRFNGDNERKGWGAAWQPQHVPDLPPGRKYYIAIKSLKPADESFYYAEEFNKFHLAAISAGIPDVLVTDRIYGLQEQSLLREKADWIEFIPYVMNEFLKIMTPQKEIEMSLALEKFDSYFWRTLCGEFGTNRPFTEASPMQQFCDKLKAANKTKHVNSELARLVKVAISLNKYNLTVAINFNQEWKKIEKIYPILQYLNEYGTNKEVEASMEQYVKLIDADNDKKETEELVTLAIAIQKQEEEPVNVS